MSCLRLPTCCWRCIYFHINCFRFCIGGISDMASRGGRHFPNKLRQFDPSNPPPQISKDVIVHRTASVIQDISSKLSANFANSDGGLYVGCAGVAYALWYVAESGNFPDRKEAYLQKAKEYIDVNFQFLVRHEDRSMLASFLLGNAGVYVAGALIYNSLGDKQKSTEFVQKFAELAPVCLPVNFLRCGSDELFVGRAGYLCGVIELRRRLGVQVLPQTGDASVHALCAAMVKSGREYSKRHNSPSPLMYAYYGTEYLGAAHGMAGILLILLSFPDFLQANPDADRDVRGAVDYMLSVEREGNYPPATDEVHRPRPPEHELVHWCHGAPGVIYLLARAYLVWRDDKYLQACLRCGELVWSRGLLKKGPGICHGVAGNGYVFLLLYRLTGEPVHLHRAEQFQEFLFTQEFQQDSRTPDCPYSLYEGVAGTVCFMSDLANPEKAAFPFSEVF
ncbi:lanC-like protein 3 isoform X1 [Branchiostoma floridae x Branchiostoma japonicum]